jgi:hypothetical protein
VILYDQKKLVLFVSDLWKQQLGSLVLILINIDSYFLEIIDAAEDKVYSLAEAKKIRL